MKTRVSGLGGVFFKARNPGKLAAWYARHLGVPVEKWGGAGFPWRDDRQPRKKGHTVWSPFPANTGYLGPGKQALMVTYRVASLNKVLAQLKKEGVWIDAKAEESEFGKFGWIKDPEGDRIELWQPPA
jgi:hypothetical protein